MLTILRQPNLLTGSIVLALAIASSAYADSSILYVGDGPSGPLPINNAIKRFDATNGKFLDSYLPDKAFIYTKGCSATDPWSGSLCGPVRMLFQGNTMYLGNQNTNRNNRYDPGFVLKDIQGEVLRYLPNGKALSPLVPAAFFNRYKGSWRENLLAPHTPSGMLLYKGMLYVGDLSGKNSAADIQQNILCDGSVDKPDCLPGTIIKYQALTGMRMGTLPMPSKSLVPAEGQHPRGMVMGPDNKLYIAYRDLPTQANTNLNVNCAGYIIRFNFKSNSYEPFVRSNDCGEKPNPQTNYLHRPDGITFGPDGNLYVNSFRKDATEADSILIFSGPYSKKPGQLLYRQTFGQPVASGGSRYFAQDAVFGPGERLYTAINGGDPAKVGEIRAYNVKTGDCRVVVPSQANGGALAVPWYISFDDTDPATRQFRGKLDYNDEQKLKNLPKCS